MTETPAEELDQQLRRKHGTKDLWRCPTCHYSPNVGSLSEKCQNCGRDFLGQPAVGNRPISEDDREPRPGLRSDVG